jgi:hypothetical protein
MWLNFKFAEFSQLGPSEIPDMVLFSKGGVLVPRNPATFCTAVLVDFQTIIISLAGVVGFLQASILPRRAKCGVFGRRQLS